MFGIDTEGRSACIYITGFNPFFYVKVDDNWKNSDMMEFVADIRENMGKYYESSLSKCKFVKKKT